MEDNEELGDFLGMLEHVLIVDSTLDRNCYGVIEELVKILITFGENKSIKFGNFFLMHKICDGTLPRILISLIIIGFGWWSLPL